MIARVGYFDGFNERQRAASQDNWDRRFRAALTSQPGLVAVFHCVSESGTAMSLSVWESVEAATEGGKRANAVPLLPGQVGEDIPSPDRTEFWTVEDSFVAAPGG